MAHGTRVNNTAYGVTGGKCLVGGTEYNILGGRTLIDGTGYSIKFTPSLTVRVKVEFHVYGANNEELRIYIDGHSYYQVVSVQGLATGEAKDYNFEYNTGIKIGFAARKDYTDVLVLDPVEFSHVGAVTLTIFGFATKFEEGLI